MQGLFYTQKPYISMLLSGFIFGFVYVNKKYAKLYDLLYELDMKNVFVKNDQLNEDIINSIKENHYFNV